MVKVRIEEKPSFQVIGEKTWISGQDNEQFGVFWAESEKNGLLEKLRKLNDNKIGEITKSHVFGVSCVEKDPDNRAFDFFIAAENPDGKHCGALIHYTVPACKWAIFSNQGELPMSLIDAEMYAFMDWLPSSGYKHALAPELEVYPAHDGQWVEFWLPIEDAIVNTHE